jgi:hypothetical protein
MFVQRSKDRIDKFPINWTSSFCMSPTQPLLTLLTTSGSTNCMAPLRICKSRRLMGRLHLSWRFSLLYIQHRKKVFSSSRRMLLSLIMTGRSPNGLPLNRHRIMLHVAWQIGRRLPKHFQKILISPRNSQVTMKPLSAKRRAKLRNSRMFRRVFRTLRSKCGINLLREKSTWQSITANATKIRESVNDCNEVECNEKRK